MLSNCHLNRRSSNSQHQIPKTRNASSPQVPRQGGSVIVFCNTKRGAQQVADDLSAPNVFTKVGYKVGALHGDRCQRDRELALQGFRDGA
eukprot:7588918-Pyramimonas_sp.AAC.1